MPASRDAERRDRRPARTIFDGRFESLRNTKMFTRRSAFIRMTQSFMTTRPNSTCRAGEPQQKSDRLGRDRAGFLLRSQPARRADNVFRRQIRTARDLDLPIIIHSDSDANDETVEILTEEECSVRRFSRRHNALLRRDARDGLNELMSLGFLISFAGNVTFKKAETCETLPGSSHSTSYWSRRIVRF